MSPVATFICYDRQTNATVQITHASANVTYSGVSISQDGRYVVYQGHGDALTGRVLCLRPR